MVSEKKSDIAEIKEFLQGKTTFKSKEATIISDNAMKQYSIRIPKKFVRMFNIEKGMKFEFRPIIKDDKLILVGEVKNAFIKHSKGNP